METDKSLIFTRKSSGLVKGLSWKDIFIIVISAPAGSGILYYSVSTASTYPGGNIGISFLIGMLLFLPVIYLASISSNMIPRSGSLYVLISRTLNPAIGFLASGLFFIGYTLSIGIVAFIETKVIGGIFVNYGLATKIESLQTFGASLQTPLWSTIGGCILVLLTWLIVLRGIKVFKFTMRIFFYLPMIAIIITIVVFCFSGFESSAKSFNLIWGANKFEQIIELANQNGWCHHSFSWNSTFNLLLVVLFSYGGLELISYASGEVSKQQKKNTRAYLYAGLLLGILYTSIAFSVLHSFGDFLGAYDFVYNNYNSELAKIMPPIAPSVPFYISSLISNPWIGIMISICISFWLVNTMIPYFFAPSRIIFALAMDRLLPESIADVNVNTGAPTKASHLTLLFALLGVFFTFLNVGTVLGTILFCALFIYWLYGASAMILPYNSPLIYEQCSLKKNLFNIPILTWLGGIVFAIGWLVIFISVKQMSYDIMILLCLFMSILMVYYFYRQKIIKNYQIDSDYIFNQLPPE
jgi:basic amino acid/polyamine antiporter, APA family